MRADHGWPSHKPGGSPTPGFLFQTQYLQVCMLLHNDSFPGTNTFSSGALLLRKMKRRLHPMSSDTTLALGEKISVQDFILHSCVTTCACATPADLCFALRRRRIVWRNIMTAIHALGALRANRVCPQEIYRESDAPAMKPYLRWQGAKSVYCFKRCTLHVSLQKSE